MIYFVAGAEFIPTTQAVIQTYAKAALLTAYSFVVGAKPAGDMAYVLKCLQDRPTIVDSGIFTIQGQVWPAGGPTNPDKSLFRYKSSKWMRSYVERYVLLLQKMNYQGLVVECDCHELTANWQEDLAWAREKMRTAFGDRVIHVWSSALETRQEFFDMVKRYKRVAISEPGMKVLMRDPSVRIKAMLREANVPHDHHVHVLGSSNFEYTALPDNYSIDASTWSMIVRYGRAFPNSPFAVYWWRRQKLEASPAVLAAVDEKFEECYRNAMVSPLNKTKKVDRAYLRALAAAMVASQFLVESQSKHYDHPHNDTITGAKTWHTGHERTKGQLAQTSRKQVGKKRQGPAANKTS